MQALGLYESTSRKTVLALSIEQTDIEAGSGSSKAKQERIALVCFPSWKLSGTVTWWKETSSGHCFCFQVNYILGFDIPFGVLCIQSESRLQCYLEPLENQSQGQNYPLHEMEEQ
ncbi:hypothetical protein Y1Q_0015085 [Alligator mississippiensis]|uniref:Uncharacterized protein n=1 Tax=Alligator mississippiensis TaxID=8496 RepID=A0A151P8Q5_ALLMI|nr:hypothetical protein Y1Q_0015085 [Alligator mississippiensis]